MKTVIYSRLLIVIGALTMLYTQWMPVAVDGSSVVNIHLISERQNALLFGGILFIAGVILRAGFKDGKEGSEPKPQTSSHDVSDGTLIASLQASASRLLESKWGGRAARLAIGLLMTRLFVEQLVPILGWMSADSENLPKETWMKLTYFALGLSLYSLVYAFRRKPIFSMLGELLLVYVLIALGMWAYESHLAGELMPLLHDENMALTLSIVVLLVIRITAWRKKSKV